MSEMGHNHPPSAIDDARKAFVAISEYLKDAPVIETEKTAREAKLVLDRGAATLAQLEDAREAETKPLYTVWKDANAKYKPASDHLAKILYELKTRLGLFMQAEESRRQAEATRKRWEADEAIRVAQEAEDAEREAKDNAAFGEVGVDVGRAIEAANETFDIARKADHQAAIAERDSHVRIGGGFGRVATLRSKETLFVSDAVKAIQDIGITVDISDAILKSARAFRKLNNRLPEGVTSQTERGL